MNAVKLVAIVMIVLGGLGLAYGGFSFTKDRHTAELGPLKMSVDEKEHVNIPVWAGAGLLVVGVVLLVVPRKA